MELSTDADGSQTYARDGAIKRSDTQTRVARKQSNQSHAHWRASRLPLSEMRSWFATRVQDDHDVPRIGRPPSRRVGRRDVRPRGQPASRRRVLNAMAPRVASGGHIPHGKCRGEMRQAEMTHTVAYGDEAVRHESTDTFRATGGKRGSDTLRHQHAAHANAHTRWLARCCTVQPPSHSAMARSQRLRAASMAWAESLTEQLRSAGATARMPKGTSNATPFAMPTHEASCIDAWQCRPKAGRHGRLRCGSERA